MIYQNRRDCYLHWNYCRAHYARTYLHHINGKSICILPFTPARFAERIRSISRCNTIVWRIIVCTTLSRLCIRFARVNQWLVRPRIFSPCCAGYSYACKANAENKTNHAMTQNLRIFLFGFLRWKNPLLYQWMNFLSTKLI